jgi:hypothetical protein
MVHMILAAQMTIYVGGLVVLVPERDENPRYLDVLFLRGDCPFYHIGHQHNEDVDGHAPYLVAKAQEVCLHPTGGCSEGSLGYTVQGGDGPDQVVRFPLSDTLQAFTPAGAVTLPADQLAEIGTGTRQCDHPPKENYSQQKWPVAARLRLANATVTPKNLKNARYGGGSSCDGTERLIAEGLELAIEVDRPVIQVGDGTRVKAVFKTTKPTFAIWNLPKEGGHGAGDPRLARHFAAYYSVLAERKGCRCVPEEVPLVEGAGPVFCPPSRVRQGQ